MESLEISSVSSIDDLEDFEAEFEQDIKRVNNLPNINNIFLFGNNLNHDDKVILNKCNPSNSFREVSLAFSRSNVSQILNVKGISYDAVSKQLEKYGKRKPSISKEEVERIVYDYIEVIGVGSYGENVVTSFINMYQDGSINRILSYHKRKANSKAKRNSDVIGITNLIFNFNVDYFREFHFGIEPNDMTFNPLDDREMFIIEDYVSMYWTLYMLLVFYKICGITPDDEPFFFKHFHKVIQLAMFTGMKMFVQFELTCHYG